MKDDNSEVRLNSISNLMKIADILGLDLINPAQLPTIGNLLKDAQWRVRMAAVEFIGQFSVKFGKEAY